MNAIVLVALRRPLTFVVMAILIVLFGGLAVWRTPADIFPEIGVPVVAVVWTYNGLSPDDMSGRVTYYYERSLTSTVANIEHIESQSLYGRAIVKVFFQPGTDVAAAQAQITSISQTVLKQMPAGITPPEVLAYDASSVPVLDVEVSAAGLPVSEIYDLASNFIRPALVAIPGVAIPTPYGGTSNNVEVDIDPAKMLEHGLSAEDVSHALARENIVLPAGDEKIGKFDYFVTTNSTPIAVAAFNDLPIKQVGNAIITLGDVAYVHRGAAPQTNIVLVRGHQSVLIEILKTGNVSTLAVVEGVKRMLPRIQRTLPAGVTLNTLNDASVFVRSSIDDVVQEMATAAALTGLTVLLFLGSWRSTLIVATSIPLAILSSIIALSALGQTINVMTLGGLALAVGILVDDATVMIENIATHLETGQALEEAIIEAANQIVVPTFVSTLCICIVWLPLFSLSGIPGYLFMPLAMAIVFAMIASFILSRTLVPTMAMWMLHGEAARHAALQGHGAAHGQGSGDHPGPFIRFQRGFERRFEGFRRGYRDVLAGAVASRGIFIAGFLGVTTVSLLLVPFLGRNFFPGVNSDEIDMHMRAQLGTRIEDTAMLSVAVNKSVERLLAGHVRGVVDNCGLPVSGINEAYGSSGTIGPSDCDLTIRLDSETAPVDAYRRTLRSRLPGLFPGTSFSFLPGDITAKILNFGLPSPIDVEIVGRDTEANYEYSKLLLARIERIPGVADPRIEQGFGAPTLRFVTSRAYAARTNLTEANIANDTLASLSGSGQTAPTYWLDTKTGVSHLVNLQAPQYRLDTMNELETLPIDPGNGSLSSSSSGAGAGGTQILGALGHVEQDGTEMVVSHRNITPVIDVYAGNQVLDLGAVNDGIVRAVRDTAHLVPHSARVNLEGQAETMASAYRQLIGGLLLAIVLVYLVIVVNFQSWLDPFIIITALPGALAGIVWSLFITHTTLSVPALTGAVMCMGTATANSILVVSFARERFAIHGDAARAAIEAGYARLRPVLMTALAMIIGMLPMSLSNTEDAPLGRAVMGGLLVATISTLLFVPAVFARLRAGRSPPRAERVSPPRAEPVAPAGRDR